MVIPPFSVLKVSIPQKGKISIVFGLLSKNYLRFIIYWNAILISKPLVRDAPFVALKFF